MMTSADIRQKFLDFFRSKGHEIVPSAPIVVKNDPTLMFTNAGMNQFKDYFLGNTKPPYPRVADTQKCLRVSGKHNDLEEVGVDTYHHTMFEMLGNWSFGDYFKKEAIEWSWELLTKIYGLDKDKLYVTIFEGDTKEGLPRDDEAITEWKKRIAEDRILFGNKKDNFWEMGDTGPCGPCTEIHVDCRTDEERKKVNGKTLVNADHPQVIEIWNNVFIQFNRLKDGSLELLPAKHVDTGMGLERLVRVLQEKTSNYDTDIFTEIIGKIEKITNIEYNPNIRDARTGGTEKEIFDWNRSVSFRVIADHIRAIGFTIVDGQLPSNIGAGYVIRRILRRAVRYYYTYLGYNKQLLYQLVPVLAEQFEDVFPEVKKQIDFVSRVIKEEEEAFLKTISSGIKRFEDYLHGERETVKRVKELLAENSINSVVEYRVKDTKERLDLYIPDLKIGFEFFENLNARKKKDIDERIEKYKKIFECEVIVADTNIFLDPISGKSFLAQSLKRDLNGELSTTIDGKTTFELYDTYGFPDDLTVLMAGEMRWKVDEKGFEVEMQKQKNRSRAATTIDTEDWIVLKEGSNKFIGYDSFEAKAQVIKYRKTKAKGKEAYQLVLDTTPFYGESGGQVGDTGVLLFGSETIEVVDTKKDNDLIIHFTDKLPKDVTGTLIAKVDAAKRKNTELHHTATHLLHAALRKVLGNHVMQKGSLVNAEHLRFDFSHFAKMTDEEIAKVEAMVNEKIRENIPVVIKQMSKNEALKIGAMALFGEKYGDVVRVVIIDPGFSVELCGGTHVGSTGELGIFKVISESAVAAGVRRIEAICGKQAENYINEQLTMIHEVRESLKNPKDINKAVAGLSEENAELKKKLERAEAKQLIVIRNELLQKKEIINGVTFIGGIVEVDNADALKKLCFELRNNLDKYVAVLASIIGGKPFVAIGISDSVTAAKNLDAGKIIKEHIAPLIKGGGGGQKTLATAGGQDATNLQKVIETVKKLL